jgi:hypothetical protein
MCLLFCPQEKTDSAGRAPVRDAAIKKLRDWLTPLIEAEWSVNWPHPVEMAVEHDSLTGTTVLTQRFHDHVTRYDNWTVAAQFLSAFPELAGQIRLHEEVWLTKLARDG